MGNKKKKEKKKRRDSATSDFEELPPFHSAARQGHIKELLQLLQIHPDLIDYTDSNGYTALMHAVFSQNLDCVNILLNAGSKTEQQDCEGRTALLFCARKGWSDGCEALLNFGASCRVLDKNNRNAVHFSACMKEATCLETILSHASLDDINHMDIEGMTPLHWASFHNLPQNIALLLEKGADVALLDNESKNPLHWAAQNGCTAACNSLLSFQGSKSIVNNQNARGMTPLHFAAAAGNLEVIFELAQSFGCDLDVGDREESTSLGMCHGRIPLCYNITPKEYAKQLNQIKCISLIEQYSPTKPQDVLIPYENIVSNKQNRSEKKASSSTSSSPSSSSSSDIPDSEIFSLNVTNKKEKRQIENIDYLHTKISARSSEISKLQYALGQMFEDETTLCKSQNAFRESETNFADISDMKHASLVASESSFDISEDEQQRYQAQMAISPPINSATSSPDLLGKTKTLDNMDTDNKTVIKSFLSSAKNTKLAPIRDRSTKPNRFSQISEATDNSFDRGKLISDHGRRKKLSAINFKSKSINDPVLNIKDLHESNSNSKMFIEKPVGLRRKSISMNDGLNLIALQKPTELPLTRTQSFGIIRQPHKKLPVIEAGDGRNLTQFANRKFNEIDEGYEGFDERSQRSERESDFDKRKRRIKKKQKLSKHEFLFGNTK